MAALREGALLPPRPLVARSHHPRADRRHPAAWRWSCTGCSSASGDGSRRLLRHGPGALLVFIGVALTGAATSCGRWRARSAGRCERFGGSTGRLARENAMRNPARTAVDRGGADDRPRARRLRQRLRRGAQGRRSARPCSARFAATSSCRARRSCRCRRTSSRSSSPIPASRSSRRSRATTPASTAMARIRSRRSCRARSPVSGRRSGYTGRTRPTPVSAGRARSWIRASPRGRQPPRRESVHAPDALGREGHLHPARDLQRRQLDVDRVHRGAAGLRGDRDQSRPGHRARPDHERDRSGSGRASGSG